ncbi:MAG: MBL fold metallo-hydrolase [Cephaloticoccus sp.]|nr:MBL fold metallo-hydrolase [Cephaloticoccus sp.]
MLNVANADSMLVTRWNVNVPSRILIDGGNSSSATIILEFLKARGIQYLDHIVCSHPHDDHVGGLPGIVDSPAIDFGRAWIHVPWMHVDYATLQASLNRGQITAKRVVKIIRASVQGAQKFIKTVEERKKPISEPFEGQDIGFMKVCGPTKAYYEELLKEFTDFEKLKLFEEEIEAHEQDVLLEDILNKTSFGKELLEAEGAHLGGAPTEPENNSSTIMSTMFGDDTFLFTADAGVPALNQAKEKYALKNLRWMQIPHHGSRRNITKELIEHFKPQVAFVSAEGSKKHPRIAVINAFKDVGAKVFSTHYPSPTSKWFHVGTCPDRPGYKSAIPLYDSDK